MTRVMTTDRNADGTFAFHPADYHAEVTAEKIVVVSDDASGELITASRAFRKQVEKILLAHHTATEVSEQAALAAQGEARYDSPLLGDSAATGHSVVDGSVLRNIVAASHGTVLQAHFARADVQATILSELHHETRSQMAVHRQVHAANADLARKPRLVS